MIISNLLQPVHTNESLEGINGIIIWSLSKCEIGLTAKCAVLKTSTLFHGCIVSRSYFLEVFHIKGCQITIICPLRYLRIIILHQDSWKILICCKQCVGCHNIASGNRNILNGNVVLVTEVFLNPSSPVVVGNIRNTLSTSVINRNSQRYVFSKWFPIGCGICSLCLLACFLLTCYLCACCFCACFLCHCWDASCHHSTCH